MKWWAGSVEWSLSTFEMWHLTFGTWKDAHTVLDNPWRLSWPRTSSSSCHQAGISRCHACYMIHSMPSIGEGSSVEVCGMPSPATTLARSISPLRNSWTWGSRGGRHSRSSSLGLDQLDWSHGLLSSLQVSRWGSFTMVSLSELLLGDQWVKVTHYLDQEGWCDWACLLAGSPWCDITWGTLVRWFTVQDLLHWQLPKHLWLPECATAAEGMAHPLSFILQQCSGHQGSSVGISCYGQSFLARVLLHIHEPIISGMVPGIEFSLGSSLGMLAGLHLCSSPGSGESCLHWRHSLTESRISWQICASISLSQSIFSGNLHSWYTSW